MIVDTQFAKVYEDRIGITMAVGTYAVLPCILSHSSCHPNSVRTTPYSVACIVHNLYSELYVQDRPRLASQPGYL